LPALPIIRIGGALLFQLLHFNSKLNLGADHRWFLSSKRTVDSGYPEVVRVTQPRSSCMSGLKSAERHQLAGGCSGLLSLPPSPFGAAAVGACGAAPSSPCDRLAACRFSFFWRVCPLSPSLASKAPNRLLNCSSSLFCSRLSF